MKIEIPLHKPWLSGRELHYVAQAITTGRLSSDGPYTQRCSALLESALGVSKVLLTPSCTAALELAAMLCGLGPGDEVLLPSFTFTSTATAVTRLGARPVFVDIDPDTMNLDAGLLKRSVSQRTKAIIPVHYAGVACDMRPILEVAEHYGLQVIEDAAQAVFSFYRGRSLGSLGQFGALSFHETKNIICGEGGALCVNDPDAVDRAMIIREKGTNRSRFLRGLVDKYTWVDQGSSYLPAEIASAFLLAQLESREEIAQLRRAVYNRYMTGLRPHETAGLLKLPHIPEWAESNHHLFFVLLPNNAVRESLMAYLRQHRISAAFHYIPLHLSPMGRQLGYEKDDLPVTEACSLRLLRLPMYCELLEEEQDFIIDKVSQFFSQVSMQQAA